MNSLRVLLVDDEAEFVTTIVERLRLRGIEAEALISGADALKRCEQREYDVVVVDIKMPGMDGLELLRRIKATRPAVQVILLTGRGSEHESRIGIEAGAADYLVKPINIDDLIARMRQAAGSRVPSLESEATREQHLRSTGLAFFGRVTASISHEVNNVLSTIGELSGLLQDFCVAGQKSGGIAPEKVQRLADGLATQVEKGATVVKRLNRLAHTTDVEAKTIDLAEQLNSIKELAERACALRQVKLETEFSGEPVSLHTSPFILQQAVFECIEAVLHASHPGESIVVSGHRHEDGAEIRIAAPSIISSKELDSRLSSIALLMNRLGGTVRDVPSEGRTLGLKLTIPRGGWVDSTRPQT